MPRYRLSFRLFDRKPVQTLKTTNRRSQQSQAMSRLLSTGKLKITNGPLFVNCGQRIVRRFCLLQTSIYQFPIGFRKCLWSPQGATAGVQLRKISLKHIVNGTGMIIFVYPRSRVSKFSMLAGCKQKGLTTGTLPIQLRRTTWLLQYAHVYGNLHCCKPSGRFRSAYASPCRYLLQHFSSKYSPIALYFSTSFAKTFSPSHPFSPLFRFCQT